MLAITSELTVENSEITLSVQRTDRAFDILFIYLNHSIIDPDKAFSQLVMPSIDTRKALLVNGRGPIWLYLRLYHILHAMRIPWIAQFDPALGGVIVTPDIHKTIIPMNELDEFIPRPEKQRTIAFLGPPHSGKSVLMYTLFKQLLNRDFERMNNSAYIIKGCPDGEGLWSTEAPEQLVKRIRYKNQFNQEFVNSVVNNIARCKMSKSTVFVDCGGKPDDFNTQIINRCTHAVFVAPDFDTIDQWKSVYSGINVLAEVVSVLNTDSTTKTTSHIVEVRGSTYRMIIAGLDRSNRHVSIPEEFMNSLVNT